MIKYRFGFTQQTFFLRMYIARPTNCFFFVLNFDFLCLMSLQTMNFVRFNRPSLKNHQVEKTQGLEKLSMWQKLSFFYI